MLASLLFTQVWCMLSVYLLWKDTVSAETQLLRKTECKLSNGTAVMVLTGVSEDHWSVKLSQFVYIVLERHVVSRGMIYESLFNAKVNEYAWVLKLGGIFSWWTPDFILKWLTLTNEQLHDFCNVSLEMLIIKQGHYRLVMYNALMVWRHEKTTRNALVMHYGFIPSSVVNSLLCINVMLIYFIV